MITLECYEIGDGLAWWVLVSPAGLVEFEAPIPEEGFRRG